MITNHKNETRGIGHR